MHQFALIGCGKISERHAENIIKYGKLKAVCDIIPERANRLAEKYHATAYYNIDDLLKLESSVDVVSICSPNGLHAEHSIKSLQSGKNVLCEKPLCLTSAAAWQIIETEKYSGKRLYVVKSTRFNPLLLDLKHLIDKNALGKLYSFQLSCFWNRPASYYTEWRGKLFPDGGTLYTQFSHYIDALLWLIGDIRSVCGFKDNSAHKGVIEFEDSGVASVLMENDMIGTINWSVNAYKKNHEIALTIIAEKGTIRIGGEYLNELQYCTMEEHYDFSSKQNKANDYQFYKGSMSNHKEIYEHLINDLEKGHSSLTGAFEGLKAVEAIEKIYKSIN